MDNVKIYIDEHLSIEVKKPSILNLFPSIQHSKSIHNSCRWLFQSLFGYKVYILMYDKSEIGYCAISSGSNPRYPFADKNDLIVGPYYISPGCRGKSYGALLIGACIDSISNLKKAYAFIAPSNLPSIKTVEKSGFLFNGDVSYSKLLRILRKTQSGKMKLYCYEQKRDDNK